MTDRSACGFVLKISEHGETDKLVTLYTRELGRITGIAKGACKSKKRFVNKLEEWSLLRLHHRPPRPGSTLSFIREAELLAAHLPLRQDYRRYAAAMHVSELILRFTREHDPDPELFALLLWAIPALAATTSPLWILTFALLRLLVVCGYQPILDRCGLCNTPVQPGQIYCLFPESGSLHCGDCRPFSGNPGLSVQTLRLLTGAQTLPLERLNRLHSSRSTYIEALDALHLYALHLLQQDLRSWKLVRSLLNTASSSVAPSRTSPDPGR
jgi:DNA repair protein RecO (recombination protein O)